MRLYSSIRLLYCFGGILSQSFPVATVEGLDKDCAWDDDIMEMVSPLDSDNNASIEVSSDDALDFRCTFVSKHGVAICFNELSNRSSPSVTLDGRGRISFLLHPVQEAFGRAHSPEGLDFYQFWKLDILVIYITKRDQVPRFLDICST